MSKLKNRRKAQRRPVTVDEHGFIGFGVKAAKSMLSMPLAAMVPADVSDLTEIEVDEVAVAAALGAFFEASERAKSADRDKRKHRKVFEGLPGRIYGAWRLAWKPATRKVPDLDAITAIFEDNGLGEVPMKLVSDSVEVTKA